MKNHPFKRVSSGQYFLFLATIRSRTFCLLVCCQKSLKIGIYKTIILPAVLYGCEIWSLTLREEHRLRVFENRVLRKISGPKRDEVTGEWRKLHNFVICTLRQVQLE
jgi:dolichol kinase